MGKVVCPEKTRLGEWMICPDAANISSIEVAAEGQWTWRTTLS
jgi:hypothetical protein